MDGDIGFCDFVLDILHVFPVNHLLHDLVPGFEHTILPVVEIKIGLTVVGLLYRSLVSTANLCLRMAYLNRVMFNEKFFKNCIIKTPDKHQMDGDGRGF